LSHPVPSIEQLCVSPAHSLQDALKVLDREHKRIVLVVDPDWKLLGVVADSDFRRAMLASASFDDPVSSIMVPDPVVARLGMTDGDILQLMKRSKVHEIPVLDQDGVVVGLRMLDQLLDRRLNANAIVFAGGFGRRLRPATEEIPKPLLKVGGREILFTILDGLLDGGVDEITLALHYMADRIRNAVQDQEKYAGVVSFITEIEQMGTAGALYLLPEPDDRPLIVINGDILSRVDYGTLIQHHLNSDNAVTVAVKERSLNVPFGVATLEGSRIVKVSEKPAMNFFINAGIYIFSPAALQHVPEGVALDMPDFLQQLIDDDIRVGSFPIFEYWIDIGHDRELERAEHEFKRIFES
jgi:dTDP-glucose pyrophosphorylase/predicted transcriptional regulator